MNKKAMPLPLVGASIWGGLGNVKDFTALKLGNIVLTFLPESVEEGVEFMRYCKENRIYVLLSEIIHRGNHSRWRNEKLTKEQIEQIVKEGGEYFLGRYAIGECGGLCYWPKEYTLKAAANNYENLPPCKNEREAHKAYVDYLKKELEYERSVVADLPLFNVESSIQFSYHTEAGIDGQCLELLPGDPLITLSAIRGAAKEKDMLWGVHIAMEWYGGFQVDGLWQKRWYDSLYLSYLSGAEFIFPESGHLSYNMPSAKPYAFSTDEMRLARKTLRKLHAFSKIHSRPRSGPETPCGLVLGESDGHPGIWNPYAWGQYENGREWESSDAEKGWELYNALFRREDFFHANVAGEVDYSGNPPAGQVDLVPVKGDFSAYKLLMFCGYNSMDEALYAKLIDFVKDGGHLVIYLSHFDTADQRGADVKLFRDGDLTELCGFRAGKVVREDVRGVKYVVHSSFGGYRFPNKGHSNDPYFIGRASEVEISLTSPHAKVLAGFTSKVSDSVEELCSRPLVVEHALGKGAVFTVTTLTKPGADSLRAFGENLLRVAVQAHRTDFELITSDTVRYAVYKGDTGLVVYALNLDPDLYADVRAAVEGKVLKDHILLEPNEFKVFYKTHNGVLILPQKPETNLIADGEDRFVLECAAQNVDLLNTTETVRSMTLNGVSVTLSPGEKTSIQCPAHIPGEKAQYFSEEFLSEDPAFEMKTPITPY